MKKICLMFLLSALAIAGCGGSKPTDTVSIEGEIKGIGNDTLYVYGTDQFYDRIDTIMVKNGKFSATLSPDTLVAVWMRFGNGSEYPLFMDKGDMIRIKGAAANNGMLEITGNKSNEELTAFQKDITGLGTPSQQVLEDKAETFISSHPMSLASIYLLEKYFARIPEPDYKRIRKLTDPLPGELKDRPALSKLLKQLDEEEKITQDKSIPFFTVTAQDGKSVSRSNFKDKYLLIHFWASWDEASRKENANLRNIYLKEKKDGHLALLGISLDIDKDDWETAIEKDTLEWKQACDFAGWETAIVQKFGIQALPANILLNPQGKVLDKNMDKNALEKQIEEINQKEKHRKEKVSGKKRT